MNQRPSGYEPDELPGCSTPRHHVSFRVTPTPLGRRECRMHASADTRPCTSIRCQDGDRPPSEAMRVGEHPDSPIPANSSPRPIVAIRSRELGAGALPIPRRRPYTSFPRFVNPHAPWPASHTRQVLQVPVISCEITPRGVRPKSTGPPFRARQGGPLPCMIGRRAVAVRTTGRGAT